MDEAVFSVKLVRAEFRHTCRKYGCWGTVSVEMFH